MGLTWHNQPDVLGFWVSSGHTNTCCVLALRGKMKNGIFFLNLHLYIDLERQADGLTSESYTCEWPTWFIQKSKSVEKEIASLIDSFN